MYHCRELPAKRGGGSRRANVSGLSLEGDGKWDYSMLVELETILETGLGESINNVVLFRLGQQRAPLQLWKSQLST